VKTPLSEIRLYYHADASASKKTLAYAKSMSAHVSSYDLKHVPSTGTVWQTIIDKLKIHPKELLNKAHPDYQSLIRGHDFEDSGWLNVLIRNPHLIIAPIAIRGNHAILCKRPTDIYRLSASQSGV